jgi:hypothetical protein
MSAKIGKMFAKISKNVSKEKLSKSVCEKPAQSSQNRRKCSRKSVKMFAKCSQKCAKMLQKKIYKSVCKEPAKVRKIGKNACKKSANMFVKIWQQGSKNAAKSSQ